MPRPKLAPRDGHLIGEPIAAFLPELHRELRPEEGPQFRAEDIVVMASLFSPRCGFRATKKERHLSWQPSSRTLVRNRPSRREPVQCRWIRRIGPALNSREMDVLRPVVQGSSNKEISSSMNISESASAARCEPRQLWLRKSSRSGIVSSSSRCRLRIKKHCRSTWIPM